MWQRGRQYITRPRVQLPSTRHCPRDRIIAVLELKLSADELVSALLRISETEPVCILDSCGVGHLGSHLLIAGFRPVEAIEVSNDDAASTLKLLDEKLSRNLAAVFTLSYDFGIKLQPVSMKVDSTTVVEPDVYLALFDFLLIHDYDSRRTYIAGNYADHPDVYEFLQSNLSPVEEIENEYGEKAQVVSNFTKTEYLAAVERIREHIRAGDTYQTNLTQQLRCSMLPGMTPQYVFRRLRRDHPAPFSAFLRRSQSTVVSASPERFFRITRSGEIEASPIKGTRPRGKDGVDDQRLRSELLSSAKDRAENTMIVDLVRNDLGRVCEFGTVAVGKLCDIEEHPTLFHLVSTVRGKLRSKIKFSEILRATFPCGSITGAPKVRTMQIIDGLEDSSRGLSMGAIGVHLPEEWNYGNTKIESVFDLSVAIRTMLVGDGEAVFNVGGGIVIDSDPEKEFEESILKARALLKAMSAGPSITEE